MGNRDLEYLDNIIDYCDKVENILINLIPIMMNSL